MQSYEVFALVADRKGNLDPSAQTIPNTSFSVMSDGVYSPSSSNTKWLWSHAYCVPSHRLPALGLLSSGFKVRRLPLNIRTYLMISVFLHQAPPSDWVGDYYNASALGEDTKDAEIAGSIQLSHTGGPRNWPSKPEIPPEPMLSTTRLCCLLLVGGSWCTVVRCCPSVHELLRSVFMSSFLLYLLKS